MNTPIRDFVEKYIKSSPVRMHMPAHKGASLLGCEQGDITEITGADSLYSANGIIKESEDNSSLLFGCESFYSTEGSSHCIRAMLYLLKLQGVTRLIAARNAHKAFISGCALNDFAPMWLTPKEYLSCEVDLSELEAFLSESDERTALFITTPDYLGGVADIKAISQICKRHNTLLCVDCAHGAYLRFLPESAYPTDLGADICCSSAHKTLPVLTGGAYLHISRSAPKGFCENAKSALSLFGSTSPSYLILQSLDAANAYLADEFKSRLAECIAETNKAKQILAQHGYDLCGSEPLKIVIKPKSCGYYGSGLAQILESKGIFPEFADSDHIVFMPSPQDIAAVEALTDALTALPKKEAITSAPPRICSCFAVLTPRSAIFAESEIIPAKDAEGRILAQFNVACPPAVPIAVCGERLSRLALDCFEYYGIKEISVVKE